MFADNFYTRRLQGRVPAAVLLWRDMILVGTLVNVACTFMAMAIIVNDIDAWAAVLLHLAPLPHNAVLLAALHRTADTDTASGLIAGIWFVVMLIV